jgi:hypothetical protein
MTLMQYALARAWHREGLAVPANYGTPECLTMPIDPAALEAWRNYSLELKDANHTDPSRAPADTRSS